MWRERTRESLVEQWIGRQAQVHARARDRTRLAKIHRRTQRSPSLADRSEASLDVGRPAPVMHVSSSAKMTQLDIHYMSTALRPPDDPTAHEIATS